MRRLFSSHGGVAKPASLSVKPAWLLLLSLFVTAGPAGAALDDLGNGLVNDTTQDITWLKDANLVKTSCDADNALWQAFEPSSVANNSGRSKAAICGDNGRLNWYEAEAWVAVLNTQNYLGHSDWRQPATGQPDPTCSGYTDDGVDNDSGYRCEGSELGHLFNVTLGNPNDLDDDCYSSAPDRCLQNKGPFDHFQPSIYWSGTEYAPAPTGAWFFITGDGIQDRYAKGFPNGYVWPVRSGQSAVSGVCGPADGTATLTPPASGDLCAAGTARDIYLLNGRHVWTCTGNSLGSDASCGAPGADAGGVGGSGSVALSLTSGEGCTVASAGLVEPPGGGPGGVVMPYGAIEFTLTGCTGESATMKVAYSGSVVDPRLSCQSCHGSGGEAGVTPGEEAGYYKYLDGAWARVPATLAGHWVVLTIEDNGPHDTDPVDGIIRDPGGLGIRSAVVVPTLSQWALLLLAALLAALGTRRRVAAP